VMRRAILVSVMTCVVPLSAAAQSRAAATPATQGPMIVETIHSGFLAAPDFKITELDGRTSGLVGGYAGWVTDDTFFVGGGGYWLANTNRNDPEMAYGGLVVQWLALKSGRLGLGMRRRNSPEHSQRGAGDPAQVRPFPRTLWLPP